MGDRHEVVVWLELVCACANVLCWLSKVRQLLITESTSQIVPTWPSAPPSRAHTDAHALAPNRITHQKPLEQSEDQIQTRQK